MKLIEHLNEIDWSKNIILFMLYITIIALSVLLYLLPIVESHKIQTLDFKKTESLNTQIQSSASNLNNNFESLLNQNKEIHDNMRHEIDLDSLKEQVAMFLSNVNLNEINKTQENDLIKTTIEISGFAKNINDIMNLIGHIASLKNSVKIAFPIDIKKEENSLLALKISIIFYQSTYNF